MGSNEDRAALLKAQQRADEINRQAAEDARKAQEAAAFRAQERARLEDERRRG